VGRAAKRSLSPSGNVLRKKSYFFFFSGDASSFLFVVSSSKEVQLAKVGSWWPSPKERYRKKTQVATPAPMAAPIGSRTKLVQVVKAVAPPKAVVA